jgi:hypothetical protein
MPTHKAQVTRIRCFRIPPQINEAAFAHKLRSDMQNKREDLGSQQTSCIVNHYNPMIYEMNTRRTEFFGPMFALPSRR